MRLSTFRALAITLITLIVGYSITTRNIILLVIAAISGILLLSLAKRRVNEVVEDGGIQRVSERASRRALQVFGVSIALISVVLISYGIEAGHALTFSAGALAVLYLTFYTISSLHDLLEGRDFMSSLASFILGLLMIFSGLILWNIKFYPLGVGLIIAGAILLITEAINLRKPESERILDERVERINERAAFYAFWILVSSLAVATVLSWYFELRLRETLEYVFFAGIFSFVILRSYLSRGV